MTTLFYRIYEEFLKSGKTPYLQSVIETYAKKVNCPIDEAKDTFSSEKSNYRIRRKNKKPVLQALDYKIKQGCGYHVFNISKKDERCISTLTTTDHYVRCSLHGAYSHEGKLYCHNHKPKEAEYNTSFPIIQQLEETNYVPHKDLMKETDIEKLRAIAIVLHKEYPKIWPDVLNLSIKRYKNIETLKEINKLQLKINKLREKLQ